MKNCLVAIALLLVSSASFAQENFNFHVTSDDGVRLWINNMLVIDNWTDHAPSENVAVVSLVRGQMYSIKLEYYENSGGATIKLKWNNNAVLTPVELWRREANGTYSQGAVASYFNNINFTSEVLTGYDSIIDFEWGAASPHPSLEADTFSIRWEGYFCAGGCTPTTSGAGTFAMTGSGGLSTGGSAQSTFERGSGAPCVLRSVTGAALFVQFDHDLINTTGYSVHITDNKTGILNRVDLGLLSPVGPGLTPGYSTFTANMPVLVNGEYTVRAGAYNNDGESVSSGERGHCTVFIESSQTQTIRAPEKAQIRKAS